MSWTFLSAAHFRTWTTPHVNTHISQDDVALQTTPLLGHGVTRGRKKALKCGRCRRNRQYTPDQKRKAWEDLLTTAPFFERITCLRERDGQTLPNLNFPSRDLNAREVKRRGERSGVVSEAAAVDMKSEVASSVW